MHDIIAHNCQRLSCTLELFCFCLLAAFRLSRERWSQYKYTDRMSNWITSTLCLVHCSSGDCWSLVRTDQTLPGSESGLEVTQRTRLADFQAIQRVAARLTLPCKQTTTIWARPISRPNRRSERGSYLCTQWCCGSAGRPWMSPQGRTYTPADPPGPGRSQASSSHTHCAPERSMCPPDTGLH